MEESLFTSPGMLTVFIILLVLEGLSLLLLLINIQIFRSQSEKYRLMLSRIGGQGEWGTPGRFLIPLYIVLILGVTVATILIFVFQPHLL